MHVVTPILVVATSLLLLACAGDGGPGPEHPMACTQEAKVCPDGSSVSRQGPNCEFAPCPGS